MLMRHGKNMISMSAMLVTMRLLLLFLLLTLSMIILDWLMAPIEAKG